MNTKIQTRNLDVAITMDVLAIGVDVTWHGGSSRKTDASSRYETIAFSTRDSGEWSLPVLSRVKLTEFNPDAGPTEANSDPRGHDLLNALRQVLARESKSRVVVLSLDAPLEAKRRDLPARKKQQKAGEVERRDCDRAWSNAVKTGNRNWKGPNIQPGAPLPKRIDNIVKQLEEEGFAIYSSETNSLNRVLIECFPNEAIWSSGSLGFAKGQNYQSMTAYKRMGKEDVVLPLAVARMIFDLTIRPCLNLVGLSTENWLESIWQWILKDELVTKDNLVVTGKAFDDAIDSVLALSASIGFSQGNAHIHQGDLTDGHIIGPGRFPVNQRGK